MKFTASKKIIALVAAAAMLTGVAACGSSSNSSSSGVTEGGKTEITVWVLGFHFAAYREGF